MILLLCFDSCPVHLVAGVPPSSRSYPLLPSLLQMCAPNPLFPLPPDTPCRPCNSSDYEAVQGVCADSTGRHNVTYRWLSPLLCSSSLPGSLPLPGPVLVGPCVPTLFLASSAVLPPLFLALFVLSATLIAGLAIAWLLAWLRHRRLYSAYQELTAERGEGEEGEGEEEDEGSMMMGEPGPARMEEGRQ